MSNVNVTNEYFLWLLNLVNTSYINEEKYSKLLWYLFNREFTWVIPNDENRAIDAIELRYEFSSTYGLAVNDGPCSVLEVLIRLANDWEHELTYDFHKGDRTSKWFWIMLDNLGLLDYPDWSFEEDIVDEIVSIWLDRRFEKNGIGSVFPVKSGIRDQRSVEIWLQLQDYVLENVKY